MRLGPLALSLLAGGVLASILWPRRGPVRAQRIVRISRVVSDLDRATSFYRDALGFRVISRGRTDGTTLCALGKADADEVVLQLGETTVALVRFGQPEQPYPVGSQSNDLWFQHLAIVVRDMDAAYDHLVRFTDWQPISIGGPQLLPPSNGDVRAFKFRDPDGHPLELIWFPGLNAADASATPIFIRVDHSALSVASVPRSLNFYRALGFRVSARSLNQGPAQVRLDGLPDAHVRVVGLTPAAGKNPGLELLGYHPPGRARGVTRLTDITTDWVTMSCNGLNGDRVRAVCDPDGHRLVLIDQGARRPP